MDAPLKWLVMPKVCPCHDKCVYNMVCYRQPFLFRHHCDKHQMPGPFGMSRTPALPTGSVDRCFNSLTPVKFELNLIYVIFKRIWGIDGWGLSCEIAFIWMSLDFTDNQSILVHVMAWWRLATSHYVSQCWPRSLSPYGVTRPQWVNTLTY